MAIIDGFIQSKARKSIGNVTYSMLGSSLIAREKIVSNKSNTPLQAKQRDMFGKVMYKMRWFLPWANIAYRRNGRRSAWAEFCRNFYSESYVAGDEPIQRPAIWSLYEGVMETRPTIPMVMGDERPIVLRFSPSTWSQGSVTDSPVLKCSIDFYRAPKNLSRISGYTGVSRAPINGIQVTFASFRRINVGAGMPQKSVFSTLTANNYNIEQVKVSGSNFIDDVSIVQLGASGVTVNFSVYVNSGDLIEPWTFAADDTIGAVDNVLGFPIIDIEGYGRITILAEDVTAANTPIEGAFLKGAGYLLPYNDARSDEGNEYDRATAGQMVNVSNDGNVTVLVPGDNESGKTSSSNSRDEAQTQETTLENIGDNVEAIKDEIVKTQAKSRKK